MPTSVNDIQQVQDKRREAASLMGESNRLNSDATSFKDMVMADVRAARAERGLSLIGQDRANVTGQLASDPAGIRERTANVNPMAVDAITARSRAQNLNTLATISGVEQERSGQLNEIIQAGANQILASAQAKAAEAQQAQQEADALMETLKYNLDIRKQDFSEFMSLQDLALAQAKAAAGSGSGSGEGDLPEGSGVLDYINSMKAAGERNIGRDTYNTIIELNKVLDALDSGASTGPLSAALESWNRFTGKPTETTNVMNALTAVRNIIRNRETGVQFSEKEQQDYLDRLPTTWSQEGTIKNAVQAIVNSELRKLSSFNIPQEVVDADPSLNRVGGSQSGTGINQKTAEDIMNNYFNVKY